MPSQVLAVILIAISAATLGVIKSNDDLIRIRNLDGTFILYSYRQLYDASIATVSTMIISLYIIVLIKFYFTKQHVPIHAGALTTDEEELQALIVFTEAAGGWLIFMNIGIVIAVIIAIVLLIANIQGTVKLVVGVLVSFILIIKYYTIV